MGQASFVEYILFTFVFLLILFILINLINILVKTHRAVVSGKKAELVQGINSNHKLRILLIGDCASVSVGVSKPEYSLVGRMMQDYNFFEIINASKNSLSLYGAVKKMDMYYGEKFDLVIIQTGSIDTILLKPDFVLDKHLDSIKNKTKNLGNPKVLIMSMCNIGSFPLFMFPFNHLYSRKSLRNKNLFDSKSKENGFIHVPLHEPLNTDNLIHPTSLFTYDGIHPNDEGYGIWYKKLKVELEKIKSTVDYI